MQLCRRRLLSGIQGDGVVDVDVDVHAQRLSNGRLGGPREADTENDKDPASTRESISMGADHSRFGDSNGPWGHWSPAMLPVCVTGMISLRPELVGDPELRRVAGGRVRAVRK